VYCRFNSVVGTHGYLNLNKYKWLYKSVGLTINLWYIIICGKKIKVKTSNFKIISAGE
jgi:hypothetical protein